MTSVYISGYGMVTSLGENVEENWSGAIAGESGIGVAHDFPNSGENSILAKIEGLSGRDRLYEISKKALQQCIENSKLSKDELSKTALVFAHASGDGVSLKEEFELMDKYGRCHPNAVYRAMNSYIASRLSSEFGLKSVVISTASACAGSALAIHTGHALIKSGSVDRCICGGGDIIDQFAYMGFESMRIVLSRKKDLGKNIVQPFGEERSGIVLGEGAGFVLLESGLSNRRFNKRQRINIESSIFENEPNAVYGDVPVNRWVAILEKASTKLCDIGYLVAHGTSTPSGDMTEGKGIIEYDNRIAVSSYKYYFGHTLSASSVIDLIFICKCLEEKTFLGVGWDYDLDRELVGLNLLSKNISLEVNRAAKLTAGFGGGIGCLILNLE